jgi:hypothetical protein
MPMPPADLGSTMDGWFKSDSAINATGRGRLGRIASTRSDSSAKMCCKRLVDQGMHGVQPQRVDVELAQPADGGSRR